MWIVSLILLFFCFTANGMTTKEFLDYCREHSLKCTVNDEHHVPGEVVNHNDFHSPCEKGETTCIGYDSKDRPNKIVCKKGDVDC
ncbi:MAG: hypothetical protein OEZ01_04615 [Candidatus Heimdallarchaeota archaeon]|nr:hypothetical protein [Candidatus Heimdallarchaeota archaeon]